MNPCKNIQGNLGVQEETCTRFCLLFVHWCTQSLQHPAVPLTAVSDKSKARWVLKSHSDTGHSFACELLSLPAALKLFGALQ